MLLGALGASLLGNTLAGKGIHRAGEGVVRVMEIKKVKEQQNGFLVPPHPLTNFEIQICYQYEPGFNGVYSRDNLPKRNSTERSSTEIKDKAYVLNLAEYSDIGTHWFALYVDLKNNDVTYFDSFRVEHIPKEIKTFIGNKNIKTNIFRIQAYDSIMCGYFCIGFIDFMLAGKTLTDFTNLFSPNNFTKMMI